MSLEQDLEGVRHDAASGEFGNISEMIAQVLVRDAAGRFRDGLSDWLEEVDRALWPWRHDPRCAVVRGMIGGAIFGLQYPPHGVEGQT